MVMPLWMCSWPASAENSSMRAFTSWRVTRSRAAIEARSTLSTTRLVGLDDAVGHVDAEVALGPQHRDPQPPLEHDLVLGRPDLDQVGAGVAGGQDVGDAHGASVPQPGAAPGTQSSQASHQQLAVVEQRADLGRGAQHLQQVRDGEAALGEAGVQVLDVLPGAPAVGVEDQVELEVAPARRWSEVARSASDEPRDLAEPRSRIGAIGFEARSGSHLEPAERHARAPRDAARRAGREAGHAGGGDVGAVLGAVEVDRRPRRRTPRRGPRRRRARCRPPPAPGRRR